MPYYSEKDEQIFDTFCFLANETSHYHEITMKKVAEKMKVSRPTLNNHGYSCINDIINGLHHFVNVEPMKMLENFSAKNPNDLIDFLAEKVLPLLYKKRYYFYTIYRHTSGPYWLQLLDEKYAPLIKSCFENSKNVDASARLFLDLIHIIVSNWLNKDHPEHPVDFKEKFIYFMTHPMTDFFKSEVEIISA